MTLLKLPMRYKASAAAHQPVVRMRLCLSPVQEEVAALVDTGADWTLVAKSFAAKLGITFADPPTSVRGLGGGFAAQRHAVDVALGPKGELSLPSLDVWWIDDAYLRGFGVVALIGQVAGLDRLAFAQWYRPPQPAFSLRPR